MGESGGALVKVMTINPRGSTYSGPRKIWRIRSINVVVLPLPGPATIVINGSLERMACNCIGVAFIVSFQEIEVS